MLVEFGYEFGRNLGSMFIVLVSNVDQVSFGRVVGKILFVGMEVFEELIYVLVGKFFMGKFFEGGYLLVFCISFFSWYICGLVLIQDGGGSF